MCFYIFNFVFLFFNFAKIDKLIFLNKILTWYFFNIILIATSAFPVPHVLLFTI